MNVLSPSVSVQYIRHIANLLRDAGCDVNAWLGSVGLPADALEDGTKALNAHALSHLVEAARLALQEPAIGLLVGERLRANTHGVLGFAAMQARTMREVLHILQAFIAVRLDIVAFDVIQRDGHCLLLVREPVQLGPIRLSVLEAVMMAVKHMIEFVGQGRCEVIRVEFPVAEPLYQDFAKQILRCEVRYNAEVAALVMHASAMDFELATSDPVALKSATFLCEKTLREKQGSHLMQSRVRELLLNNQSDFPSLEISARLLGMTPRTLHRRLIDEGTRFSLILDGVRHQLAVEFLRSGRVCIKEAVFRLGYDNMANFRRAFKRWEGCSPSEFAARDSERATAAGN